MQFDTGDILIFREKNLSSTIYSIVTLNLDNHVGIIVEKNDEIYLKHNESDVYFKRQTKLNLIKNFINKEYYHYKPHQKDTSNKYIEEVEKLVNESNIINYFYKLSIIIKNIPKYYLITSSANVGKKDLSKINPYKWAYLISFLFNFWLLFKLDIKSKEGEIIPFYKTLVGLLLITIFATVGGYYSHKKIDNKTMGRRYIGCILGLGYVNIIYFEKVLNLDSNEMLFLNYFFSMPRIYLTRMASWLSNDLPGKINKKTLRPYDTALYEALFEGLVPFLFLLGTSSFLNKRIQNLVVTTMYSGSRFYIEFYKKNYISNSKLTLGQIDTIINWVVIYWYITCDAPFISKLVQFLFLNIFFFDISNRVSENELGYTTSLTKNVKLIWDKTYNKGFYNGHFKDKQVYFKLVYPAIPLISYNYLFSNYSDTMYLFNCFALLNILERFLNGHVTDYLTIQFYSLKTFNLNYADIAINMFTIYFLIHSLISIL